MKINSYIRFFRKYIDSKFRKYKYHITGKVYPTNCMFVVTDRCNFRCSMCNYWKNNDPDILTLKDIEKIFSSPILSKLYTLCITGGEPLLRKDLGEIIELAYKYTGLKPHINSNMSMPNVLDKILEKHKDKIACIHTSISGSPNLHNKIKGREDAYKQLLTSIEVIKKHNFLDKFKIGMTVSRENYKEMLELYNKFKGQDIPFVIVEHAEHAYGGTKGLNLDFTNEEKKEITNNLIKIIKKRGYWKTWKIRLGDIYLIDWLKYRKRPKPCYAGIFEMRIEANGDILPCHVYPSIGNIKEESMEKIWNSETAQKTRKKTISCQMCMRGCSLSTLWANPFIFRLKKIIPKI